MWRIREAVYQLSVKRNKTFTFYLLHFLELTLTFVPRYDGNKNLWCDGQDADVLSSVLLFLLFQVLPKGVGAVWENEGMFLFRTTWILSLSNVSTLDCGGTSSLPDWKYPPQWKSPVYRTHLDLWQVCWWKSLHHCVVQIPQNCTRLQYLSKYYFAPVT